MKQAYTHSEMMFEACNVRCTIGIYNWCTNDNGYWCSWVWLSFRYIPGRKKRYHKIQTVFPFIFSRFVCVFIFVLCFAVIWSFESMTKHCIRFAIVKMLWWCEFTKHAFTLQAVDSFDWIDTRKMGFFPKTLYFSSFLCTMSRNADVEFSACLNVFLFICRCCNIFNILSAIPMNIAEAWAFVSCFTCCLNSSLFNSFATDCLFGLRYCFSITRSNYGNENIFSQSLHFRKYKNQNRRRISAKRKEPRITRHTSENAFAKLNSMFVGYVIFNFLLLHYAKERAC